MENHHLGSKNDLPFQVILTWSRKAKGHVSQGSQFIPTLAS